VVLFCRSPDLPICLTVLLVSAVGFAFPITAIPAIPRDSGDLFSVPSFF
jgi:hypothetical protein